MSSDEDDRISRIAIQIYERDIQKYVSGKEVLEPSRNVDPVWPPLRPEEYDMLEQDTAKYFLYYSATVKAVESLMEAGPWCEFGGCTTLKILVAGCGHGRLVTLALDAARTVLRERRRTPGRRQFRSVEAHAFDCNPSAVRFCRALFSNDSSVIIHDPFCLVSPCPPDPSGGGGGDAAAIASGWPPSLAELRGRVDLVIAEVRRESALARAERALTTRLRPESALTRATKRCRCERTLRKTINKGALTKGEPAHGQASTGARRARTRTAPATTLRPARPRAPAHQRRAETRPQNPRASLRRAAPGLRLAR